MGLTNVLRDLREHISGIIVHGATSANTPNTIMARDAAGRSTIVPPAGVYDIANKGYIDGLIAAEATARQQADAALQASITTAKTFVWQSGQYKPARGTETVVAHNLNIDPNKVIAQVLLQCAVANNGYAVGEFAQWSNRSSSNYDIGHQPRVTATTISYTTGNHGGPILIGNKQTGALGAEAGLIDKWRYVFRIFYWR